VSYSRQSGATMLAIVLKFPLPIELVLVSIPFLLTLALIVAGGAAIGYCASFLLGVEPALGAGIGIWGAILGGVGGKIAQMPLKFSLVEGIDPVLGMPLDFFAMALIGTIVLMPLARVLR
jgi:hypothetical protein